MRCGHRVERGGGADKSNGAAGQRARGGAHAWFQRGLSRVPWWWRRRLESAAISRPHSVTRATGT